jgi:hypothetical protein
LNRERGADACGDLEPACGVVGVNLVASETLFGVADIAIRKNPGFSIFKGN